MTTEIVTDDHGAARRRAARMAREAERMHDIITKRGLVVSPELDAWIKKHAAELALRSAELRP